MGSDDEEGARYSIRSTHCSLFDAYDIHSCIQCCTVRSRRGRAHTTEERSSVAHRWWDFASGMRRALYVRDFFALLVTVETPSTNLVLNNTFALFHMPSFSDTTTNCACGK